MKKTPSAIRLFQTDLAIYLTALLILLIPIGSLAQKSTKRGYGYGDNSPEDMAAYASKVTWWYNWFYQPDNLVKATYAASGVEYVPMIWGGTPNADDLVSKIPDGAKYLLSFNEPNFTGQSNKTAQEAATLWPVLEDIAKRKNLKIVGPAVNYCGGGCNQTNPVQYLKDFFAACPGCQVDYIAIHWYACTGDALLGYINDFRQFKKPIWVTEFSCGDSWRYSLDGQKQYMLEALTVLETDPDVFRYSWFAGRTTAIPNADLLGANGKLTELGQLYNDFPVGGGTLTVPGKIEAESMALMKGITNEPCSDAGGGFDVGYNNSGDWMEYKIDAAATGSYHFDFRVASAAGGGSFNVLLDGKELIGTTTVPSTGDWQTWSTLRVENVPLTSGPHSLRLQVISDGFNINYIDVRSALAGLADANEITEGFSCFPNPFIGELTINAMQPSDLLKVELTDLLGRVLETRLPSDLMDGTVQLGQQVDAGLYYVRVSTKNSVQTQSVVKR